MKNVIILLILVSSFSISSLSQNVALNFDGVDDYVSTNYAGISGSGARTIEAWIKLTADSNPTTGGSQNVITDYGTFLTGERFTFNVLWGNAVRIEIGGSGLSGTIVVNDGLYHHVACVYDPLATDKYALYVDGILDVSGNLTTIINTGSVNDFRIGERIDGVNYFEGDIDEVRFYDYARTATEIANEANAELCVLPTGLVAYYRLNEGLPNMMNLGTTSTSDDSGNNNSGTLNNFTLSGTVSNWSVGPVIAPGANDSTIAVNVCGPYVSGNGTIYNASGTYYESYTNTNNCDSILEIKLVYSPITNSINVSACSSYTSPSGNYTWTGAGFYFDTLQTAGGCDSILSIALTIDSYAGTETVSGCGSFTTPDGNNTWTVSGQYPVTYTNAANCDSVVTYDVTIGSSSSSSLNITTCGVYTAPSGVTYNTSGTYTDIIPNIFGCDSTITIDLTIVNVSNGVTQNGFTLTADLAGAAYQWFTCENGVLDAPIAGETNQSFTPNVTGDYAVEVSLNNCTTASVCYTIDLSTIEETAISKAQIFPNPTNGSFTIDLPETTSNLNLSLISLQGKVILERNIAHKNSVTINEELPAGVYFIQLRANAKTATYKLVVL